MHGPPLQARVAAANGTVLQLANCWYDKLLALTDPGAHGNEQGKANEWTGASKLEANERGQELMRRAVGMAGKEWQAGKQNSPQNRHCRQTQPADSPPGTGLKTNGQQLAGLAANNSRR